MLLTDILRLNAHQRPDSPALVFADRSQSFSQLAERADRLATGLRGLAAHGDRVAILAENRAEYVECYYGVPAAGMGLTFLNYRLNPRELVRIVNDAGATVVITEPEHLETIRAIRPELASVHTVVVAGGPAGPGELGYEELLASGTAEPTDLGVGEGELAWLIYTSGTTGMPKGAMLSHRNLVTAVFNSALRWNRQPDPVNLFPWPLCHVAGYSILMAHLQGNPVVLLRSYDPVSFCQHIDRYRVTSTSVAPTMLNMLLLHPAIDEFELTSLRSIGYGSAAMPAEVLRRAMARLPQVEFSTGFGMTELAGNVMYLSNEAHHEALAGDESVLRSVGRPMPLAMVRVVDDDLADVAVGQVGEIVVRGEQVTMGYWGNPTATAEAFAGGWFHTGDLGRWDAQGNLYIVDRKKDMIITGGENVYSREVEEILYQHPAVAEAAIVGVPDETWGENVVAVIQLRDGATATGDELIELCRANLAGYKKPKRVVFVDELPKNATGKILKKDLRSQLLHEAGGQP
jgi:acyl-CoA synthetase (AMP-forming)/AMP-acid ligase II